MPETPDATAPLDAAAFRTLLAGAGLSVSDERAPLVLEELNAQLAFARMFPPAPDDVGESDFPPFDPTFPTIELKDDAV